MTILDSNIWIAFFNFEDNQHQNAEEVVLRISKELIIPEYVITEVCTVLTQKINKQATNKFLDFIFSNSDIQVLYSGIEFFQPVLVLYQKLVNDKLSFIDVSLLYLSRQYQVVTFDKKLEKAIVEAR